MAKPAVPALEAALNNSVSAENSIKILINTTDRGVLLFGPEIYTVLLKALTNSYPEVRELSAGGLNAAQTNAEVVVPALLRCLHDRDDRVRGSAALALGGRAFKSKAAEIIPALIPLLSDTGSKTRRFAAVRLGLWCGAATNSILALRRLAQEDLDPEVRNAAAKAIIQIEQNHY